MTQVMAPNGHKQRRCKLTQTRVKHQSDKAKSALTKHATFSLRHEMLAREANAGLLPPGRIELPTFRLLSGALPLSYRGSYNRTQHTLFHTSKQTHLPPKTNTLRHHPLGNHPITRSPQYACRLYTPRHLCFLHHFHCIFVSTL